MLLLPAAALSMYIALGNQADFACRLSTDDDLIKFSIFDQTRFR